MLSRTYSLHKLHVSYVNALSFHYLFRSRFINIWIVSFAVTSQVVYLILPGRQPLELYLCSGLNPNYGSHKVKVNIVLFLTICFSLLINILILLKIKIDKINNKVSQGKNKVEKKSLKQHLLTDLSSSIAIVIMLALSTSGIASAYKVIPENMNKYPNYLFIYGIQIVVPSLGSFFCMSLYFGKNRQLRLFFLRGIRESLRNNIFFKIFLK